MRALYNDVTFIDEFLTPEFCRSSTSSSPSPGRTATSATRSRRASSSRIKEKLLFQLTNVGNPFIYVEDANYENRGELLLRHEHRGVDLRVDYARETMRPRWCACGSGRSAWRTIVDGKQVLLRYDGKEHSTRHDAP